MLTDVRAAVIGRVFAYQPRRIEITPTEVADTAGRLSTDRCGWWKEESAGATDSVTAARSTQLSVVKVGWMPDMISEENHLQERITATLDRFRRLPKVELHRHLEGSLRLNTMLDIAHRHNIAIPEDVFGLSNLVQMQEDENFSFRNFLAKFDTLSCSIDRPKSSTASRARRSMTPPRTTSAIWNFASRPWPSAGQNASLLNEVMDWVIAAAQAAAVEFDIVVRLIPSVNRHESPELAEQVAWLAAERQASGVVGVDLAGNEAEFPGRAIPRNLPGGAAGWAAALRPRRGVGSGGECPRGH